MSTLDIEELKSFVRAFNEDPSNVTYDTALHDAVRGGLESGSIPLIVLAINSFWEAKLETKGGDTPVFYCQHLSENLGDFRDRLEFLKTQTLPIWDNDLLRHRIVGPACEVLLDLLGKPNGAKHYVFATKLMFWLADLPPYDSRAGEALTTITGDSYYQGYNAGSEEISRAYSGLISRYNEFLKQIHEAHLERDLVEYDFMLQPEHLRRRNTLVRIVDKYLWLKGKPAKKERARGDL